MQVIAVTTPFTQTAFQKDELLDARWIVNDPNTLPEIVLARMIENQYTINSFLRHS
jgi:hypothetical protein